MHNFVSKISNPRKCFCCTLSCNNFPSYAKLDVHVYIKWKPPIWHWYFGMFAPKFLFLGGASCQARCSLSHTLLSSRAQLSSLLSRLLATTARGTTRTRDVFMIAVFQSENSMTDKGEPSRHGPVNFSTNHSSDISGIVLPYWLVMFNIKGFFLSKLCRDFIIFRNCWMWGKEIFSSQRRSTGALPHHCVSTGQKTNEWLSVTRLRSSQQLPNSSSQKFSLSL